MVLNWHETSTKKGAVWVMTFIIGVIMVWFDKDVTKLILLTGGVTGGMGLVLPDKT
jgi:hypothetical protein